MQLRAPCALRLYKEQAKKGSAIEGGWGTLAVGDLIEAGEIIWKELDERVEVVLEVQISGDRRYVLVRDISDSLRDFCEYYRDTILSGARAEEVWGALIRKRLRIYQRATLRAV